MTAILQGLTTRPLDRLGRALVSPPAQAVLLYVLFLGASLTLRPFARESPLLLGAAALTFFSIAAPLALVFVPRFGLRLVFAVVVWLLLFMAILGTCQALMGRVGDDAMVFLGAFMVFPVALIAAGVLRLVRSRRAGAPRPPAPPAPAASA